MRISQKELSELAENEVLIEYSKRVHRTPMQLIEPNKSSNISALRYLYFKLRCEEHGLTLMEVEQEMNRHHTTVSYGVKRINIDIKYNKRIAAYWEKVKDIPGI